MDFYFPNFFYYFHGVILGLSFLRVFLIVTEFCLTLFVLSPIFKSHRLFLLKCLEYVLLFIDTVTYFVHDIFRDYKIVKFAIKMCYFIWRIVKVPLGFLKLCHSCLVRTVHCAWIVFKVVVKCCSNICTINNFRNGVYPASVRSLLLITTMVTSLQFGGWNPSFNFIPRLASFIPGESMLPSVALLLTCLVTSVVLWVATILFFRYTLKLLFMYKGWMYESRGSGKGMSTLSMLWVMAVKLFHGRNPLLYSYQSSLPRLALPSLDDTMKRYLKSVRPLLDDVEYEKMVVLTKEFQNGIGVKLQRYLFLKSWWATNYVSDWWEEYVYLHGRSPIMVNSNFYGIDAIMVTPTTNQAARAANLVHSAFLFRRGIHRQTMKPIMVQGLVPLCSWQYERLFNTTRIPGVETDRTVHLHDSQHIVVYYRGCYFKVPCYHKGRLLRPCEMEFQFESILNMENLTPQDGEEHLAALTAGSRITWAKTRAQYFSKGTNKASLDAIEKATFVVAFDEEPYNYDPNDPTRLDYYGRKMLHGNGYNRWFDKSFTMVIGNNGRVGFNAEHSWADAPIMAHFWEFVLSSETVDLGYTEDGHTIGTPDVDPPAPMRLKWHVESECIDIIQNCVLAAQALLSDVDLRLCLHNEYGKGFMKQCKVSPDAYIQMALQWAYFKDAGKFSLTYEASMTRLFREGRTETVRPVTMDSCNWVRAMESGTATEEEKRELLRKACLSHQRGYQDAMCGKGIDRHIFCLYVIAKYLEIESPFLNIVLSEPWKLSTSQTPHRQTEMLNLKDYPNHICGGGGFGPVADDGYGVSYLIAGEDVIIFHISSKVSSNVIDSLRFLKHLKHALRDMRQLFEPIIKKKSVPK